MIKVSPEKNNFLKSDSIFIKNLIPCVFKKLLVLLYTVFRNYLPKHRSSNKKEEIKLKVQYLRYTNTIQLI